MKFGTMFLLVCLLTGCGFLYPGDDHPHQVTVEEPPVVVSEDNSYLYIPEFSLDEKGEVVGEVVAACNAVEYVNLEVNANEIESVGIFGYKTIERSYTFVLQTHIYDHARVMEADHVHLAAAEIFVVSGDSLEFIEWTKTYIDNFDEPMIGWTPNPEGDLASLRIDGSIDLKPYMRYQDDGDGFFKIQSKARGSSPESDTYIATRFRLMLFRECD